MNKKNLIPIDAASRFIIAPLPTSLVTCMRKDEKPNIIAISLLSKCYGAPMKESEASFGVFHIMVHTARYSHKLIEETGEFVINIPTVDMAKACWICGAGTGRNIDRFKKANLTPIPAKFVKPPLIDECPINIECKVVETMKPIHSNYTYFLGKALAIHVREGVWNGNTVDIEHCPMPLLVGSGVFSKSKFIAPGKTVLAEITVSY